MIYFEADQEDFEDAPQEVKDHLWQAFIHKAGLERRIPGRKLSARGNSASVATADSERGGPLASATTHP